jgi:hypothetical protein
MIDFELILYDGQRQVFTLEYYGLGLLNWMSKENKKLLADRPNINIQLDSGC